MLVRSLSGNCQLLGLLDLELPVTTCAGQAPALPAMLSAGTTG